MASIEAPASAQADSAISDLSGILLAGLKALADAGEAEQASRLAGHACAVLRHAYGAEWRGFNTLLHRLARRTGPIEVSPACGGGEPRERPANDYRGSLTD